MTRALQSYTVHQLITLCALQVQDVKIVENLRGKLLDAEPIVWWQDQQARELQANAWYDGAQIKELHRYAFS